MKITFIIDESHNSRYSLRLILKKKNEKYFEKIIAV